MWQSWGSVHLIVSWSPLLCNGTGCLCERPTKARVLWLAPRTIRFSLACSLCQRLTEELQPGWLAGPLNGWQAGCQVGWKAAWRAGWMTGWLPRWVASWLVGCLAAWLLLLGEEGGYRPHLDQAEPGRVPIVRASIRLPHTATLNTWIMWEWEKMVEARERKKKQANGTWGDGIK